MAATFMIPSAFTAIDKFSGPVKNMGNAIQGFVGRSERLLGRANAAFTKLMTPISSLNKMLMGLGYYVGLFTLVRIIKNAIDIFADFQQAQVDIRAVTKNNIPITNMLADNARVLALRYGESATAILATDLALIKMGYSADRANKAARPILTGSAALKAEPEELAKAVGATMSAFKLPSGSEQMVVDMFAKAADISALDWKELQTMLPIAQGAASITGHTLPEMLGLFSAARNAQVHVASGSTAIKNMMIKSGIYDKDLNVMLQKITSSSNKIKTAFKMFGPKTLVTALPLAEAKALGDLDKMIKTITNDSKGYADTVANIRLDSFRGAQKLFTAAYQEFIFSIEDGNGSLAQSLTRIIKVSSAMLLLSSDSDQARKAIEMMNPDIVKAASNWLGWLKVIGWVTAALIAMKVALMLWRGIVIAATIVQGAWSVAMGVSAALGWKNVWALRGNAIALGTLRTVTLAATLAHNAWNYALKVGPLFAVAEAILLVVAAMKLYDDALAESQKSKEDQLANQFSQADKPWFVKWGWADDQNQETPWDQIEDTPRTQEDFARIRRRKAERINPKSDTLSPEEMIQHLLKIVGGKMTVNINDPNGYVKDVKSDSALLMPQMGDTNRW